MYDILEPGDVNKLLMQAGGRFSGKSGAFLNKATNVQVGQTIHVKSEDWKIQTSPRHLLGWHCLYSKTRALYKREFKSKKLQDGSGWLMTRVK